MPYLAQNGDELWADRHPKTSWLDPSPPNRCKQGEDRGGGGQEAGIQGVPLCGSFPLLTIQQEGYTMEKCLAPQTAF